MTVGEVISSGAGCFQWIIHGFLSHILSSSSYLQSPNFRLSNTSYCIVMRFYEDVLSELSFSKFSDSPLHKLNVKLGMRTGHNGKIEYRCGETDDYGYFTIKAWMKQSEFFQRRCEILTDGCLTVFCELRRLDAEESASMLQENLPIVDEEKVTIENEASERDSDEEETGSEGKSVKKLQKDLKNWLISGEDCDVTIKVQGKEFPAHRNFLRARSPVFNSMFSHEMVEKQSGVVVIDDCDPAIFPDFLNYVYTGNTKHISDENVIGLYTASDKYCVKELKEECAAFMKSNMSVGTFCDTITLALLHTEKELIDLATEFFCSNLIEIIKTAKWHTFLHENTTVGNELFIKAFSRII